MIGERELPPELQNQIIQYKQVEQQLQVLLQQKFNFELQVREIDQALEVLKDAKEDTPIYKSIGSLLIKANSRTEIVDELNNAKESINLKLTSIKKQEERLKEKYESLQKQLTESLQAFQKA
ncbi:MAG: prefoldin subunit beta [Thermoplasmata archaeon]|nr:prefoldin subunit beta [Thermoplasmata archaeon]